MGGSLKSTVASLRTLTLPFGATSGARIVLDGITGLIQIYDSGNHLVLELRPDAPGLKGNLTIYYVPSGRVCMSIYPDGGFRIYDDTVDSKWRYGFASDGIVMMTSLVGQTSNTPGQLNIYGPPGQHGVIRTKLSTGYTSDVVAALGSTCLQLFSPKDDFSQPPFMQFFFESLNAGCPRPVFDFTGPGCAAGQEPRTVMNDAWYGTAVADGLPPTQIGSYGKGVVAYYKSTAGDVARAGGINTNAFVTATFDATRLYEVTLKSSLTIDTAAIVYAIELSEGGTIGVNNGTIVERFRRIQAAEVPAGSLAPYSAATTYYSPASSGVKTLRIRPGVGNAGMITLGHGAGNFTWLVVKDLGLL